MGQSKAGSKDQMMTASMISYNYEEDGPNHQRKKETQNERPQMRQVRLRRSKGTLLRAFPVAIDVRRVEHPNGMAVQGLRARGGEVGQ